MILSTPVGAAELSRETIAAWNAYVARNGDRPGRSGAAPRGDMIDVPGGTIYHSSGSILIRNTTVDRVVHALMYPGTPPPQEDVLESRVLARSGDTLRVYLKLARSADRHGRVRHRARRHLYAAFPNDGDEPQRLDADRRI